MFQVGFPGKQRLRLRLAGRRFLGGVLKVKTWKGQRKLELAEGCV